MHIDITTIVFWGRKMKDYIEERVLELAHYILESKSTVRKAAKKYNISKSTVHTERATLKLFISKWRKSQKYRVFQQNGKITSISTTT